MGLTQSQEKKRILFQTSLYTFAFHRLACVTIQCVRYYITCMHACLIACVLASISNRMFALLYKSSYTNAKNYCCTFLKGGWGSVNRLIEKSTTDVCQSHDVPSRKNTLLQIDKHTNTHDWSIDKP